VGMTACMEWGKTRGDGGTSVPSLVRGDILTLKGDNRLQGFEREVAMR
jgi:hypothetical protein